MPRYHFNVYDGVREPDIEGTELDSVDQARIDAVRLFGEVLLEKASEFWTDREMRVEVTDASGLVLFVLQMTAIISPSMRR